MELPSEDLRRMLNAQLNPRQAQENPSLGVLPAEGGVKALHRPSEGSRGCSWPGNTFGVSLALLEIWAYPSVDVCPQNSPGGSYPWASPTPKLEPRA